MKLTKENLSWALCSMMDGIKEHEIQEITGHPPEKCALIWSIYVQALENPCWQPPENNND